jgi:hypothetical protein
MSSISGQDVITGAIDQVKLSGNNLNVAQYVWDTNSLSWVKQTGSAGGAGTDVTVTNFPASFGSSLDASVDKTQITVGASVKDRQRVEAYIGDKVSVDASLRTRVSQLTTLFDGKTLNADETQLWDTQGTGTATFGVNAMDLSVTTGQYVVRQGKLVSPYFSGKSQLVEITFDKFANETGVVKRAGYFNSSTVAPYDSAQDGFWIEATGTSYKLCCAKNGVKTLDLDWTQWSGYSDLVGFDWSGFNVILFDFLWLGGAVLRLFFKVPGKGFTLAHQFDYAGSGQTGVFIRSPQKPVRYEIRSTTGSGQLSAICSQVSSEGSVSEQVKSSTVYNNTVVNANAIGTIYALKGVRNLTTFLDQVISVVKFGGSVVSNQLDGGALLLMLNPTLSAPLTWAANGRFEDGTGDGTQTVTNTGLILDMLHIVNSGEATAIVRNVLSNLPSNIDGSFGAIVLGYSPYTATQQVTGLITTVRN